MRSKYFDIEKSPCRKHRVPKSPHVETFPWWNVVCRNVRSAERCTCRNVPVMKNPCRNDSCRNVPCRKGLQAFIRLANSAHYKRNCFFQVTIFTALYISLTILLVLAYVCKRILFAFMFSVCNHVAPGPVMMSNNGQAVTNTTGSVTSLLGVGEFSWAVNSSGHFFKMNKF